MRIEICIAKEKMTKMPNGAVDALKEELTRRISKRYDDVEVMVKATSNDGLSVTRTADKDSAKTFVQETLKDTWNLLTSGLFTNKHVKSVTAGNHSNSRDRTSINLPQHVLHTTCRKSYYSSMKSLTDFKFSRLLSFSLSHAGADKSRHCNRPALSLPQFFQFLYR